MGERKYSRERERERESNEIGTKKKDEKVKTTDLKIEKYPSSGRALLFLF